MKSDDATVTGSRIILRTTTEKDLADYQRWSDPTLPAWQFDGPWFNDDHSALLCRRQKWLQSDRLAPYSVLEIDTLERTHIGWVSVYHKENDPHMTKIGINIVEDAYWGQGLGTEAMRLWIDYLFVNRGFTRIGFSTWSGNPGPIIIGRKLGFDLEALIRKGCEIEGKFYDRVKMGILRTEWEQQTATLSSESDDRKGDK